MIQSIVHGREEEPRTRPWQMLQCSWMWVGVVEVTVVEVTVVEKDCCCCCRFLALVSLLFAVRPETRRVPKWVVEEESRVMQTLLLLLFLVVVLVFPRRVSHDSYQVSDAFGTSKGPSHGAAGPSPLHPVDEATRCCCCVTTTTRTRTTTTTT